MPRRPSTACARCRRSPMSRWTGGASPSRWNARSPPRCAGCVTRATLILVVILLGFGAVTFSLWVGGQDVIAGRMTGGELSAFVLYAVLLATSGATMSEIWGDVQRAAGAAERLLELLAEQPTITAPPVPAAAAEAGTRADCVRGRDVPLSDAAAAIGARRLLAGRSSRARRWRWSAPPAPARRRCCNCCCASTIRSPAWCGWTAWTSRPPTRRICVRGSGWCRRSR